MYIVLSVILKLVLKRILKYSDISSYLNVFLVIDYSVVEKFLALCCCVCRHVDQRTNNKNTVVAVINIYCNYLQQNGDLIHNIAMNYTRNNSNNL